MKMLILDFSTVLERNPILFPLLLVKTESWFMNTKICVMLLFPILIICFKLINYNDFLPIINYILVFVSPYDNDLLLSLFNMEEFSIALFQMH